MHYIYMVQAKFLGKRIAQTAGTHIHSSCMHFCFSSTAVRPSIVEPTVRHSQTSLVHYLLNRSNGTLKRPSSPRLDNLLTRRPTYL